MENKEGSMIQALKEKINGKYGSKEKLKIDPRRDEKDPYLWARREWDFQINRSYKVTKTWQLLAIIFAAAFALYALWSLQYISKPKLIPYVIEMRPDGSFDFRGIMQADVVEANDVVMTGYIERFVKNLRTVSTDRVILQTMLADNYYIATPQAQNYMTDYISSGEPMQIQSNGRRRDVRFILIEKVNETTWRAEWEEEYRFEGIPENRVKMSGTFSYLQLPMDNPELAKLNNFGIFFTDIYIAEKRSQE
jgi:type IV secretory pathway TrbF-like protein